MLVQKFESFHPPFLSLIFKALPFQVNVIYFLLDSFRFLFSFAFIFKALLFQLNAIYFLYIIPFLVFWINYQNSSIPTQCHL